MRVLLAIAALGAGMVPGQNADLGPPVPDPRRVYRHRGWPEPRNQVPREPTTAELRAEEKRKRKAAKRLAEVKRGT